MNREAFFEAIRPLFVKLDQSQVDGINIILDTWEDTGYTDIRWLAYALATAYHETAKTMRPIDEYGRGRGLAYGKPDPITKERYFGRGLVQLTWKYNYERVSTKLGIDAVNNPDVVKEPAIAAKIMFLGMAEGWFTGKRFRDYFNGKTDDPVGARRIINGIDRATMIAGYHKRFLAAIRAE